jgi:DNA-binding transcriptional regulator YdaS (Cro superfamily)
MQNAIEKAIKLAGSQSKLAQLLGISAQALGQQLKQGGILPSHCIAIEKLYPGQISRYDLDPEHFGTGQIDPDCVVIVLQNFRTESNNI